MNGGGKLIYCFEGIEVNPSQHTIKRNGQEFHLRQRSFEVLLYLVENRDRVVTKEELIEKFWKVQAVTDDALVQSIVEIRKMLGEDSRVPRMIKTIPKTGYRFIGELEEPNLPNITTEIEEIHSIEIEVEEEISDPQLSVPQLSVPVQNDARQPKRRLIPIYFSLLLVIVTGVCVYLGSRLFNSEKSIITLANTPENKSVAVFFFENQSGDRELNWLREGLADMIITDLSHSRQLALLSRQQLHSILERTGHKETEKIGFADALTIARKTKAQMFVLGGFGKAGDQIRIDVQLYDSRNGQLLGADDLIVYKPEEILTKIDLLSLKIASRLGVMPAKDESIGLKQVMTNSLDAYRYYSLAVEKAQGLHNTEAIELLNKAIAIDPQFAMAHARIGYTYAVAWNFPNQAKPHLEKAFQLSERLTEKDKLYISAWYAIANQDYSSAIPYFREIVNRYPFEVEAYIRLGHLLVGEGRYQEAKDYYRRGLVVDPDEKEIYNSLGGLASSLGKHEEAIQMHQIFVKLAPMEPNAHDSLALSYAAAGFYQKAIEEYNRALELNPDFEVAVVHLGNAYFQTGRYQSAMQQYKRYIQIAPTDLERRRGYSCIAYVYLKTHHLDLAEQALRQTSKVPGDIGEFLLLEIERGNKRAAELLKSELPENRGPGRGQKLEARTLYYPLGYFSLKNGKADEAVNNFRKALESLPPTWSIDTFEDCLANAYLELGRFDEAIAEYERVLRLNPNYPLAHFHLAQAYEGKREMSQARHEYQEFLQIWKNADSDIPEILIARQRLQEPAKQI